MAWKIDPAQAAKAGDDAARNKVEDLMAGVEIGFPSGFFPIHKILTFL